MCSRITCPSCQKPTWAGCGRHIEAALAGVAPADRCKCREQAANGNTAPKTTAQKNGILQGWRV